MSPEGLEGAVMARDDKGADATIAELVAAFPATFTLDADQVRPLKNGVREELYDAAAHISHRRISAALARYCRSPPYLKAVKEGVARIGLDGQPAGQVTETEAEAARKQLAALGKRNKAAKEKEKAAAKPAAPPAASGPKRLSLSDLKKAVAARKQGR
jgi:ProP effector